MFVHIVCLQLSIDGVDMGYSHKVRSNAIKIQLRRE